MTEDKSRIYRSIQNSIVGLAIYMATLFLSFVSRKIFLEYLGPEVLGLNTTAQNLLGFLNIAELGIGSAIACTLYHPLYEKDERSINEIVSLQGWLYRRIACVVIVGALVLMAFFPLIFQKADVPFFYTYLSFGVIMVGSLLSYFFNYQCIVLSANQKEYKVKYCGTVSLAKVLLQILAVRFLAQPYMWWCVIEFLFAIIYCYVLHVVVRRDSPFLKTNIKAGREYQKKYPKVITMVKQLFFHKIGEFFIFQSGSLIIYAFTNLSMVALVGNYSTLVTCLQNVVKAAIGNIGASVGNLVSQGDKNKIMLVFEELFSMRFFVSGVLCICLYFLATPFVIIWIGREYVLSDLIVFIFSLQVFIAITRTTIDDFLYSKGLFSDIWAPFAEAGLNFFGAILLGSSFGLTGILSAALISQLTIIMIWKPYFLFRRGLNEPVGRYVIMYLKHLVALSFTIFTGSKIIDTISEDPSQSILSWIVAGIMHVSVFGGLLYFSLLLVSRGMRALTIRFFNMISLRV